MVAGKPSFDHASQAGRPQINSKRVSKRTPSE
jgi:hypothetical protein